MRSRNFALGKVVTLSAIRLEIARKPFASVGSIRTLNRGAWTGSVVSGTTVTEPVSSKRLSWMIATGRGLPA